MVLIIINSGKLNILKKTKVLDIFNFRNKLFNRRDLEKSILIFSILMPIFFQKQLLATFNSIKIDTVTGTIKWEKIDNEKQNNNEVIWKKFKNKKDNLFPIKPVKDDKDLFKNNYENISSFNRSIVFNDSIFKEVIYEV